MKKAEYKERYIPFRKKDIIDMILNDGGFESNSDAGDFGLFCGIVESIFHFEFYNRLERLKDSYYPINPDLKKNTPPSSEQIASANNELFTVMQKILNDANYNKIA